MLAEFGACKQREDCTSEKLRAIADDLRTMRQRGLRSRCGAT
jgi:hypothetical protein